jgi:hypothetical protein
MIYGILLEAPVITTPPPPAGVRVKCSILPPSLSFRAMKLLLQAGADPNVRDEYSTPFKTAGKKKMRVMDGECIEILASEVFFA